MNFWPILSFLFCNIVLSADQYSILLTGDTHFGLHYREEALVLPTYESSITEMTRFFEGAAYSIGNLESAIAPGLESPFSNGKKRYLHNEIPELVEPFIKHFSLVSLANNHAVDFGTAGLDATQNFLKERNILTIGAGKNRRYAAEPVKLDITLDGKTIKLAIFSCFDYREKYDKVYGYYAGSKNPGVLSITSTKLQQGMKAIKKEDPERKIIVFPHWGDDYQDVTEKQQRRALTLVKWHADLIVGHGAHLLQDIDYIDATPVVYGLGNFVFNTPGRYAKKKKKGYSLVAYLDFKIVSDAVSAQMRFYPVLSDNVVTDFHPRPVNDVELEDIKDFFTLRSKPSPEFTKDDKGYFFTMPLPWYNDGH